MNTREVVLCKPVRAAIGGFNGSLKGVPATDLGASVVRETLRRSKLDADSIGSVVLGNVIQAGNKMNPARQASIGGGLPVSVPAMTVNRVCGSEAQAMSQPRSRSGQARCRRPSPAAWRAWIEPRT
jgi:acetyl-CoA C-acetyltransferase